ncbi:unnamed protein product [Ceratitis capitata]|uniref:(Mediterranean fruit fly) hypothetical protein n=1 Tax=Ceratitis capitata TaxID=7213 RepID=A0A811UGG9_CERCA|nr:unnamed protein product [Ceratitis capitata]
MLQLDLKEQPINQTKCILVRRDRPFGVEWDSGIFSIAAYQRPRRLNKPIEVVRLSVGVERDSGMSSIAAYQRSNDYD